ncbi:MAG: hypothetical protein AAB617_01295 [Patescibacteria group bacterium]
MRKNSGQIALPFILLISGLIVEISIAGAFVTYFLSSSGLGERQNLRATSASYSGIRDAMIKITRDKEYASGGTQNYNLTVDADTTAVTVSRSTDNSLNIYTYTATSVATAGSRQKKFVATLIVNQTTGQVQLQSLLEQAVN